jgi:hypothetical protein
MLWTASNTGAPQKMNKELWEQILQFGLDSPPGEYSFSTRLASENYWTKDFTS